MTNIPYGCAVFQRVLVYLDLKKCVAERSHTHGEITTCTSKVWGPTSWKAALKKWSYWSWWTPKWTWASICKHFFSKRILGYIRQCCQQVDNGDLSSLLSPGKVTAGARCPVLSSPFQEQHGHSEERPVEGYKHAEGTGTHKRRGCSAFNIECFGGFYLYTWKEHIRYNWALLSDKTRGKRQKYPIFYVNFFFF